MLGSNGQTPSVETLSSVSYLEGFLENTESLPAELQYYVTLFREIACQVKEIMADINKCKDIIRKNGDAGQKKQAVQQIQRLLIKQNEFGDQKLEIMTMVLELIENKTRELESDDQHLETPSYQNNSVTSKEEESAPSTNQNKNVETPTVLNTRSSNNYNNKNEKSEEKADLNKTKRHRRYRGTLQQEQNNQKEEDKKDEDDKPKKKKSRRDKMTERLPSGVKIIGNIDPNEPVYCSCREVSYGEMIGCDNENCAIEWFHFHCVNLTHKPKGKWFCPSCRGDRQNLINPELAEQQRKAKKNAAAAIAASCGD